MRSWSLIGLVSLWVGTTGAAPAGHPAPKLLSQTVDLDQIQRAAFEFLWEAQDPASGLIYNTSEPGVPASPTALGAALSAIPIGIERGWITQEQGYQRARELLHAAGELEQVHGFFYHFFNAKTSKRVWQSEVSCIDSSILFAGAIVSAAYFPDTEVAQLANTLVERADWPWFLNGEARLMWAWTPERGFEGGRMDFSESILAYLLALGSSTHPISPPSWEAMRRPVTRVLDGTHEMVYTYHDGSLFTYLLPMLWFDLRNKHDAFLDYWTNASIAIRSNMHFSQRWAEQFRTYREGLWGLSAALGPDGYKAYGAWPAHYPVHDGTVAPYVVAAALPWFPDVSLDTLRRMRQREPRVWTRYGFGDALNLDREFVCREVIALDQAMVLLMIENARTELIWRLFMRHPIAKRALAAAGFALGSLEAPLPAASHAGNPGASIEVPMADHAVAIDGDLHEWIRQEALELTPTNRRNVETGTFKDAQDASALIYLGWTSDTIYVAGLVRDDALMTRQTGARIYEEDCVELFWDLDGDGFEFDTNPVHVQLGLAPSGPSGTWQVWAWGQLKQVPSGVRAAVKAQEQSFLFELAIPRALLPNLSLGHPVRFSVAYHDRDPDGTTGKLHWSIDTASLPGTMLLGHMTLRRPAVE